MPVEAIRASPLWSQACLPLPRVVRRPAGCPIHHRPTRRSILRLPMRQQLDLQCQTEHATWFWSQNRPAPSSVAVAKDVSPPLLEHPAQRVEQRLEIRAPRPWEPVLRNLRQPVRFRHRELPSPLAWPQRLPPLLRRRHPFRRGPACHTRLMDTLPPAAGLPQAPTRLQQSPPLLFPESRVSNQTPQSPRYPV